MERFSLDRPALDPFGVRFEVPVRGGMLNVARSGPPPEQARAVVVAAHGVTASLMTWQKLASLLPEDLCFIAPDLRGRGRSATLPGPYGIGAHVADLMAVLDHLEVPSAILVGHSMGAYVIELLAAAHPDRAATLVLLDAGIPLDPPVDVDEEAEIAVASVITRLRVALPSPEHYIAGWRAHPAFSGIWSQDLEVYARYDLVEDGHSVRCVASLEAARTDTDEMVRDQATRTALEQVRCPVRLLRAERGLFDDAEDPLIPGDMLDAFVRAYPWVPVERVADVNHYTLVMGDGSGPHHVAAAVEAAVNVV
jgi:lipase